MEELACAGAVCSFVTVSDAASLLMVCLVARQVRRSISTSLVMTAPGPGRVRRKGCSASAHIGASRSHEYHHRIRLTRICIGDAKATSGLQL
eukprot:44125-Eustigmatos_ZCMA.PRE.2